MIFRTPNGSNLVSKDLQKKHSVFTSVSKDNSKNCFLGQMPNLVDIDMAM